MATAERIRDALDAQPFRPFNVNLVDGTTYTIRHPNWISVPPVERPRDITIYEVGDKAKEDYTVRWININLVLEVSIPGPATVSPAGQAEGNGD
jgi:hypothetical protein